MILILNDILLHVFTYHSLCFMCFIMESSHHLWLYNCDINCSNGLIFRASSKSVIYHGVAF